MMIKYKKNSYASFKVKSEQTVSVPTSELPIFFFKRCTLGCFKIAPLSNFITAQQISDGVLAADYEFDIIF